MTRRLALRVFMLALVGGACHPRASAVDPSPSTQPPILTADGARRVADAWIAREPRSDTLTFHSVDENPEEFLVHYTRRLPCPSGPLPEGVPADAPGDGERSFTAVVDICPTASPGGSTVHVRKADGQARYIGGE